MKIKHKSYSHHEHKGSSSKKLQKFEFTFFTPSLSFLKPKIIWKLDALKVFINGPDFYRTALKIRRWEFWKWKREAELIGKETYVLLEDLFKKTEKVKELNDKVIKLRKLNEKN